MKIYEVAVVEVPTHRPMIRADHNDQIYKTKRRQVAGGRRRDQGSPRGRPADPGRHDLGRDLRDALRDAEAVRDRAQRAQREARVRRARRRDGRPGGTAGRGHDRHQHGRPRRRHQARRRPRATRDRRAAKARRQARRRELGDRAGGEHTERFRERCRGRRREGARARGPVHLRHRAPRVTADRQPAPWPLGPPGRSRRVALLPLRRGRPDPAVRRRADLQDPRPLGRRRRGRQGVPARGEDADAGRSRTPRRRSSSRTS